MTIMIVDKNGRDISNLYPELSPLLMTAIKYGLFNIATLLIKAGCDTKVTD